MFVVVAHVHQPIGRQNWRSATYGVVYTDVQGWPEHERHFYGERFAPTLLHRQKRLELRTLRLVDFGENYNLLLDRLLLDYQKRFGHRGRDGSISCTRLTILTKSSCPTFGKTGIPFSDSIGLSLFTWTV